MKQFRVVVNGNEYKVAIEELAENAVVETPTKSTQPAQAKPAASLQPSAQAAPVTQAPSKAGQNEAGGGNITAAMPGTILDVKVNVGDTVKRGQALLILEAMKMENEIMASCDGIVDKILAAKGASVNSGDLLMVLA